MKIYYENISFFVEKFLVFQESRMGVKKIFLNEKEFLVLNYDSNIEYNVCD